MNVRKLEHILRRCESESVPNGQRMLAAISLLRAICEESADIIKDNEMSCGAVRDAHIAVERTTAKDCRNVGSYRSGRSRGWGGGSCSTNSPHPVKVSEHVNSPDTVTAEHIAALQKYRHDMRALKDRANVLDQYVQGFCIVRDKLLDLKTINADQVDMQSVLIASQESDKWEGRKATLNHIGQSDCASYRAIHGSVAAKLQDGRNPIPNVQKWAIDRKGPKNGRRVSVKRGEHLVSVAPKPWNDERTLTQRMFGQWTFRMQYQSEKYADHPLMQFWATMQTALLRGSYFNPQRCTDIVIRWILKCRRYCAEHGLTESRLRALHRVITQQSACQCGATGLPISVPESIGSVVFNDVRINVIAWQVITESDSIQWESSCRLTGNALVDRMLQRIRTHHSEHKPDETRLGVLRERFDSEFTAMMRYDIAIGNGDDYKTYRRKRIAEYASKLNNIPVLTLQDSYASGNCAAGTAEFCRHLGIVASSITGHDAVRLWKKTGWIENGLFTKVIDRVWQRMQSERKAVTE